MGVTPNYQDGLTLSATNNSVAGSNSTGLNNAFGDALSLSQVTSQTIAGPLVLSGAISCTNTLTLASTLIVNGGEVDAITTISSNSYTVLKTDRRIFVTSTVATTIALPALPDIGMLITIKGNAATDSANINITAGTDIDSNPGNLGIYLAQKWASIDMLYTGTTWLIL